MEIVEKLGGILPRVIEWRHWLHAHPETAFEEKLTSAFIAEKLESFDLRVHRGLAGTGLVGALQGGSGSGGSIGLRAEMDALPLAESGKQSYRSLHERKMHACGHDGHMAMLLAAAGYLAGQKDSFDGTVHFIFQPAEESEGGARAMIEDGLFEKFPVDAVFGLHNFPFLPLGCFAICPGPVMAACDIFEVTVRGKGGHAAMPHLSRDPLLAAAQMVAAFQGIVSRNLDPLEAALISVTQFQGGSAWNIIPETVVLRGTTRSFREEVQLLLESRLREITAGVAAAAGVEADLNYQRRYPPTVNAARETGQAIKAACRVAGAEQVITNMKPQMGSEDFSFMLQQRPGAYIGLGGAEPGRSNMLHQPDYDFNDQLLPLGAAYWISLVELLLPGRSSQGACKNGLSD